MPRLFLALLISVSLAFAASPVAKISSTGPFLIDGVRVPAQGIANWPLVSGDKLVMKDATGQVIFRDGTRLLLRPNTRITIGTHGERTLVELQEGIVEYKFARDSNVDLRAISRSAVAKDSLAGRLAVAGGEAVWSADYRTYYMLLEDNVQRQVNFGDFSKTRLTPFTAGFGSDWSGSDEDWGTPPGALPPGGGGTPGSPEDPDGRPPISDWR